MREPLDGTASTPWNGANPYLVALLATAVVLALRLLLELWLGAASHPFMVLFIGSVTASAWYGGLRTGLLAVLLGGLLGAMFMEPLWNPRIGQLDDLVLISVYLLVGVQISFLCERLHDARRQVAGQAARQRQDAEALARATSTLQALVDSAPLGICVLDAQMRYRHINQTLADINGLPVEAHLGKTVGEILPEMLPCLQPQFEQVMRSGEPVVEKTIEGQTPREPGKRRCWLHSLFPIPDAHGRPEAVGIVVQEVTEQRRIAQDLKERETRYRLLAEAANDAIWDWDVTTGCVEWNEGLRTLFGYGPEHFASSLDWWTARLHPEDRERVVRHLQALVEGSDDQWRDEYRFLRADGSSAQVFDRGRLVRDAQGRAVRAVGSMMDMTERKAAEERVRRISSELQRTLDTAATGLTRCSRELRYLSANPAYARIAGVPVERIVGRPIVEVVGEAAFQKLQPYVERVLQGERVEYEDEIPFIACGPRYLHVVYAPDEDREGRVIGWVGSVTDITDRKRAQDALEEADRRKDEFLATLAHELRNPLAPIRSAVEIMKRTGVDEGPAGRSLEVIDRQLGHLVKLVDDLLDVSRITRGKLHLHRERVSLSSVVEAAVESALPLISRQGHDLSVLPGPELWLDGDPTRLSQVFANLLTNAAKYTPHGGKITLEARQEGNEAVVTVQDTGIGIPKAMLTRIFDLFSQMDRTMEKTAGGLGIGLSLVQQLVVMHGGRVEAHSEGEGKGSTFIVRLPLLSDPSRFDRPSLGAPLTPAEPKASILVVDDNQDAAESMASLLEMFGHEVRTAYDGEAGVEQARAFRPQVVFLDLGMPRLDGYEACRRIRAEPWGRDIVLVALTGWGTDDDRRRTREAGFDHHLTKPVDPVALRKLLYELVPETV